MNTTVSIILDINHQHNHKEEISSTGQNAYDIGAVDLIGKSTESTQSFKMGLYENLLSSPKKSFWNSPRISKQDVANVFHIKSSPKRSPKRVLSPKSEMNRFKRRRLNSPQKNKISKYLIKAEMPDCKDERSNRRRYSTKVFSSNNVGDENSVNLCEYNSVERTGKDYKRSVEQSSKKNYECEVIVISSDEDDNLKVEIVNRENESAINRIKMENENVNKMASYIDKSDLIEKKLQKDDNFHCGELSLDICSESGFSTNNVTDKKCLHLCEYNTVERTCSDYSRSVEQVCKKNYECEVVVNSCDEDDLEVLIVNRENETANNRIKISSESVNEIVSYNDKSELIKKNVEKDNNSYCEENFLDEIKKCDSDKEGEECTVLSDRKENGLLEKFHIVDLTYDDDCALDEAGAVIASESIQSMTSALNDNDYDGSDEDDDCVSEKSFKGDVIIERRTENYMEKDFDNCVAKALLLPPISKELDNNNNDSDSDVVICEDYSMKNKTVEESVIKDWSFDNQLLLSKSCSKYGSDENEIHPVTDKALLDPQENARNSRVSSFDTHDDDDDDESSDSSLPSPPVFQDDITKVQKKQSSHESKSTVICSNKSKVNEDVSENNLKEILQNKIFSSNPDINLSLSKCDSDTFLSDKLTDVKTGIQCAQDTSSKETDMKSHCHNINPSAERVCQVQAEILLLKLNQPWLDLASQYISRCCIIGPTECVNLHGKKADFREEADYNDENLILRMESGLDAVDLLQSRIDFATFPSLTTVQYVLLCCMDSWEEGVQDALMWLYQLLDEHPPCAFGMLDYYKRILFASVESMDASEGTFWWCITKIEEIMETMRKEDSETSSASKNNDSYQFIEEFLETFNASSEQQALKIKHSDKLEHLFGVLDFMISVMEADLNIGLLKHIGNLRQYTCKTGKPLIAVAIWGANSTTSAVNAKCRQMFKMYFKILKSFHGQEHPRNFKRLISLMAGVIYASERNSEPPKYPNVESKCKEFAGSFASVMMGSELNLAEVPVILNTLRPEWLRICVCSKLLEKLCGRNVELSLQPTVHLLRNLCTLNYDFPSEEEISTTLLGDPDIQNVTVEEPETIPQKFMLAAKRKDKKGETRLHIACRRNNVSEVEKLLNVPCINVNEKDNAGWTPLHEAALHGSVDCVRKLLNFRTPSGFSPVDLRAKNNAGITPLMDAVLRNHLKIASELLQHGGQALLSDKDDIGRSPWDFAHTEEMKNILTSASDSTRNDLMGIPRSLFIKLVVLTPLAIGFYIKFSEVTKIVSYLKNNTKLKNNVTSLVKFQPVAFKKDYLEFRKLQILIHEYQNNRITNSLVLFT